MLFGEFSSQGGRSTPTSLQCGYSCCKIFFVAPSVRTDQCLFSGTRLRLSAGPRLPIPTTVLAHGRTTNQHHNHDSFSCPNTRHERGDRISRVHHSSCCVAHSCRTAPIHNHFVARTGHSCQGRNERTSVLVGTIASLLIQLAIASLSRTFVPRSLGFSFVPQRITLNCPSRNAC